MKKKARKKLLDKIRTIVAEELEEVKDILEEMMGGLNLKRTPKLPKKAKVDVPPPTDLDVGDLSLEVLEMEGNVGINNDSNNIEGDLPEQPQIRSEDGEGQEKEAEVEKEEAVGSPPEEKEEKEKEPTVSPA